MMYLLVCLFIYFMIFIHDTHDVRPVCMCVLYVDK